MRKVFQHPYLVAPEMDNAELPLDEQHKQLTDASGKLLFLKQLLPRLKARGHRVLLFSQFKIALDLIEDFLRGEGYKYLRLDGDVNQLHRQKDMDKFNAPNSEYFIFLLTTRAGGVGINLASADTVIIHDPDFNPHQDLQAISRAHRYGQDKRVLVFKLMMENSAEARIINTGKKKLVLDHLVVQQLGKEREEGDYENLILYGAEEITKGDVDDDSTTRHWTPQMIDELIDGAEREAEEMAEVQKEANAARAAAIEHGDEDATKKKGFAFAKIWETKDKKLEAAPDEDEEEPEFDEHGWIKFLESAEAAQEAERQKALVVAGRLRAQKKKPKYTMVDDDGGTPKKKKGKGKKKTEEEEAAETRDADFVPPADSSDEDNDFGVPENLADLDDDQRALVGSSGMVRRKLTKHERRLLKQFQNMDEGARKIAVADAYKRSKEIKAAAQQAATARAIARYAGEQGNAAAGPGPGTLQQQGHRRRMSVEEFSAQLSQPQGGGRASLVSSAHQHNMHAAPGVNASMAHHPVMQAAAAAQAVAAQMSRLPAFASAPYEPASGTMRFPTFPMMVGPQHLENIRGGRGILQNVFRILQRTMDVRLMADWSIVADTRVRPDIRKGIYLKLATIADDCAERLGKRSVFAKQVTAYTVYYFIDSGESANMPPVQAVAPNPHANVHAPAPVQLPRLIPVVGNPPVHPQQLPQPPPHRAPTWQTVPAQAVAAPHVVTPQPAPPQHAAPQSAPASQPLPAPQPLPPQPSPALPPSRGAHRETAISVPSSREPSARNGSLSTGGTPVQAQRSSRTPSEYFDAAPEASPSVQSIHSAPSSRPQTPGEGGSVRPARISLSNANAEQPNSGAQPVDSTHALQLGDSSRIPGATAAPTASQAAGTSTTCYWCQGPHPLRDCPHILPADRIDLFRDEINRSATSEEERAKGLEALEMMRAAHEEREGLERNARREAAAAVVPQKRRRSDRDVLGNVGCPICMAEDTHTAAMCPVIKAGPESIMEAMERFVPNTPTHDILSTFLRAQQTGVRPGAMEVCAFCETTCGQRVRECAEARGSRKQLKHKIRSIDGESSLHVRKKLRLLRSKRAAAEEWEWASIDRHIADAEAEIIRIDQQLGKLYQAYAEWPNPRLPNGV